MMSKSAVGCLQSWRNVKFALQANLLANRQTARGKSIIIGIFLVMFAIYASTSTCQSNSLDPLSQPESKITTDSEQKFKTVWIKITGSMCPACLKRLAEKLKQTDGVKDVKITPLPAKPFVPSLDAERHPHYRKALIELAFDQTQTSQEQLKESIVHDDFGVLSISSRMPKELSSIQKKDE
jgi:copper chaperone CopZ